jgi:hypothetical protein
MEAEAAAVEMEGIQQVTIKRKRRILLQRQEL